MEVIIALWQRDVKLLFRDKAMLLSVFVMPFFFLFIVGGGISATMVSPDLVKKGVFAQMSYQQYLFPGMLAITTIIISVYSSLTVVEDRERGYLKEVLVSPASRNAIAIGKILGCGTIALIQGLEILIFMPFVSIHLNILTIVKLILGVLLIAFTSSSIGVFIACHIETSSGFQMVEQLVVLPIVFFSGALFPINGLPKWMSTIVKINPGTYAVDMLKKIIFNTDKLNTGTIEALQLKVFGNTITLIEEIIIIALIGIMFAVLSGKSLKKYR